MKAKGRLAGTQMGLSSCYCGSNSGNGRPLIASRRLLLVPVSTLLRVNRCCRGPLTFNRQAASKRMRGLSPYFDESLFYTVCTRSRVFSRILIAGRSVYCRITRSLLYAACAWLSGGPNFPLQDVQRAISSSV